VLIYSAGLFFSIQGVSFVSGYLHFFSFLNFTFDVPKCQLQLKVSHAQTSRPFVHEPPSSKHEQNSCRLGTAFACLSLPKDMQEACQSVRIAKVPFSILWHAYCIAAHVFTRIKEALKTG